MIAEEVTIGEEVTTSPTAAISPEATPTYVSSSRTQVSGLKPIATTGYEPAPAFTICSPLASVSIDELPQIISAIYKPPPLGQEGRHQGVDFSYWRRGEQVSIEGEIVQAVLAGQVAAVIPDRMPYGNMLILETPGEDLPVALAEFIRLEPGESLYILYAHMRSEPAFAVDQWVKTCALLGEVGKSGNAGVAHLHLEMRLGPAGQTFKGMAYYEDNATEEERTNYKLWRTSKTFRHFDPMVLLLFDLGVLHKP